jgi:hypothetical protein
MCQPNFLQHIHRYFYRSIVFIGVILCTACGSTASISNSSQGTIDVNGLTLIDRIATKSLQSNSPATVTAKCNPGEVVVSGGYSVSPTNVIYGHHYPDGDMSYPYTYVMGSYPSAQDAWSVYVWNYKTTDQGSALIIAHAVCTPSAIFTQIISSKQVINDPQLPISPVTAASCPNNTTVLGGGYQLTANFTGTPIALWLSAPFFGTTSSSIPIGWNVAGYRTGVQGNPPDTTAYVVCTAIPKTISPKTKYLHVQGASSISVSGAGSPIILKPENYYTFSATGKAGCFGQNTITTGSGIVVPAKVRDSNEEFIDNPYRNTTYVHTFFPDYPGTLAGQWNMGYQIYAREFFDWPKKGIWSIDEPIIPLDFGLSQQPVCVKVLNPDEITTPTSTPEPTATPQNTPTPIPTVIPEPSPTQGNKVKPTATAVSPQCTPIYSGSTVLNVDKAYLNIDNGVVSTTIAGAHLYWHLIGTGFVFEPVNGASVSTNPASSCTDIKQSSYGAGPIAGGNGIFLVKTPMNHFAQVKMSFAVGSSQVQVDWTTYS